MDEITKRMIGLKEKITVAATILPKHMHRIFSIRNKNNKNIDSDKISYFIYLRILFYFFKHLYKEILETGYKYKIPHALGYFVIQKSDIKTEIENGEIVRTNYYLDPIKTKEHNKRIYRMDIPIRLDFVWLKGTFKNKSYYFFKPNVNIRRDVFYRAVDNKIDNYDYYGIPTSGEVEQGKT